MGSPATSLRPRPSAAPRTWLYRMSPKSSRRVAPVSDQQTIEEGQRFLGVGPTAWSVELAKTVAERVAEQEPELVKGDDRLQIFRLGTESGILQIMIRLASVAPAGDVVVPGGALVGDRLWARRGVPVDTVLRGIRLGHSIVAEYLLREVERSRFITDELVRVEEMKRVSRLLFDYIDHFSSSMAAEYKAELDRWNGGGAARRLTTVETVLGARCRDTREASAVLGYDLRSPHVAFIVTASGYRLANSVDLPRLATRLAATAGAEGALVLEPDPVTVWGWTTAAPVPETLSLPPGIRVSVGSRAVGVDGFRASHLQARHANRVSALSGTAVTCYADVEVAALVTGDVELARSFVSRELGRLKDEDTAILRATLLAYLEADHSVTQAAKVLCVSKNTVTYRVRKAEALIGRSVRERGFELLLALRITQSMGEGILTADEP